MQGGKHKGIDIGASPGTIIRSPVSGTLVNPQTYGLKGYGNAITVLDSSGDLHIFGHTTGTLQTYGSKVNVGDILSTIEDYLHPAKPNTGYDTSFGNHVHYEIRQPGANGLPDYNKSLNPLEYLKSVNTTAQGVNINQGGNQTGPAGGTDSTGTSSVPFDIPILKGKIGPADVSFNLHAGWLLKLLLTVAAIIMIFYGLFLLFGGNKVVDKVEKEVIKKVTP